MTDACNTIPTCEEMLCQALNAYNALISGQAVVEVTIEGETTEFQRTSPDKLKAHIGLLHTQCGNEMSAVIAGVGTVGGRRAAISMEYGETHYPRNCGC